MNHPAVWWRELFSPPLKQRLIILCDVHIDKVWGKVKKRGGRAQNNPNSEDFPKQPKLSNSILENTTLPETNSSPLKIGLANRKGLYSNHTFLGAKNVSFREGFYTLKIDGSVGYLPKFVQNRGCKTFCFVKSNCLGPNRKNIIMESTISIPFTTTK